MVGKDKRLILVFPAIIALIVALFITIKYGWPLSWDIYYHVHMAKLYMEHGLTMWDPLTYAPYGRPTYYPPFFHYTLALISITLKTDPFQVARFLQPFFVFSLVFSFSYLGYKLYNLHVGFMVGIILFFTALFHRAVLPLPETMALIIFPISLLFFYQALQKNKYKYAIFSGILTGIMLLTHALTAGILIGVILVYLLSLKIRRSNVQYKYIWIYLGTSLLLAMVWYVPLFVKYGYIFQNPNPVLITPISYLMTLMKTLGIPAIILGAIGFVFFLKFKPSNWSNSDILIISWLLFILILSNAYLFGFKILIDRILNFAVFPAAVLAALGVEYMRIRFNRKIYLSIVAILIIGVVIMGFYYSTSIKPMVSSSQQDVGEWFNQNGDKTRVVMSLTEGLDPIIVSISRQPVSTGGYHPGMIKMLNRSLYYSGNFQPYNLIQDDIGYFVEQSPIPHPPYFTLVYQNQDYKIWRVEI
jgi:hypothetical protein